MTADGEGGLRGDPDTTDVAAPPTPFGAPATLKNMKDPPLVRVEMHGALGITACLSDRFRAARRTGGRTRAAVGAFGQVFVYSPAEPTTVMAEGRVKLIQVRLPTARLKAIAIEDHDFDLDPDGLASLTASVDMSLAGLACASLSSARPWSETERLIAARLVERAHRHARVGRYGGGLSPSALRRVEDHVEDRLSDVTLDSMAGAAALSPFHFARAFRTSTGRTPWRFVQERRVARAAALLEGGIEDLPSVAAATGFATQSHLGRTVRALLSTTPSRLREVMRSTDALVRA